MKPLAICCTTRIGTGKSGSNPGSRMLNAAGLPIEAAIAREAGVDDFLAEAKPQDQQRHQCNQRHCVAGCDIDAECCLRGAISCVESAFAQCAIY